VKLRHLPCFRSSRYEPYLVLAAHAEVPLFDEQFKGYGKNKIQHVKHLQVSSAMRTGVAGSYLIPLLSSVS
jgi:hypothetical protein